MKVFMSWSGARSKAAAELLCDWTKCVIQASRPWISTRGIDRGALWFNEINNELKDTSVGIVCLTHENKNKPWILFEAGALAKGLATNRVCTFLVDLEPSHLQDPLAQFNHTMPNKGGLWSLVVTLNSTLEANQLDERILHDVFNTYWPQFEEKFGALLEAHPQNAHVEKPSEGDMLAQILDSVRGLSQRMRTMESVQEGMTFSNLGKSWMNETANKVVQTRQYSEAFVTEAASLIVDLMSKGVAPADAMNVLTEKVGKTRALEILEFIANTKVAHDRGF